MQFVIMKLDLVTCIELSVLRPTPCRILGKKQKLRTPMKGHYIQAHSGLSDAANAVVLALERLTRAGCSSTLTLLATKQMTDLYILMTKLPGSMMLVTFTK
jgi:hypothetical protein